MKKIIATDTFHDITPEAAVSLILHHHRRLHAVHGAKSHPLVQLFVDETRLLAEFCANPNGKWAAQLDASLVAQQRAIQNCPQLTNVLSSLGSCLSCLPEFYVLITSLESSSLLAVRTFICIVSICSSFARLILMTRGNAGLFFLVYLRR